MMRAFASAHASHPDWQVALDLALRRIEPQLAETPTLGWLYITDYYADAAEAILANLRGRFPDVSWVGGVGIGVSASGVEYFDEPALTLMLAALPREQFRLFSGIKPLAGFAADTAQVHGGAETTDLGELIAELAGRTASGYLFGGLVAGRTRVLHFADEPLVGGLSGVAFGPGLKLVSRVTQGCQPIGPARRITAAELNLVLELDGEPALDFLVHDLKLSERQPRELLARLRGTLVGLSAAGEASMARPGQFGTDVEVRHLLGLDPQRRGIAIAERAEVGRQLAFCNRNVEAARRDLVRICTEIREELEARPAPAAVTPGRTPRADEAPSAALGAVYVSCTGRGGPHFGAPSAELALVRHALGDLPLVGFFAGGEIARHHLYGYTGVLTVFTT